jgi:hypothetical protein
MAQIALSGTEERTEALRDTMTELLSMDEPRKRFAAMMSGLDIHYDLGEGHPLLGRRMPDLDLVTANGPLRVFTLLHDARPVVLNLGEPGGFDITPWADRVQLIDAKSVGTWELPALGAVTAPTAVLIRPDGYVAWVGELKINLLEVLRKYVLAAFVLGQRSVLLAQGGLEGGAVLREARLPGALGGLAPRQQVQAVLPAGRVAGCGVGWQLIDEHQQGAAVLRRQLEAEQLLAPGV